MRILRSVGLSGLIVSVFAFGQAPTFEVASIRPSPPPDPARPRGGFFCVMACFGAFGTMKVDRARVDIGYMGLDELILKAYGVQPYQLSGPNWMQNQRFDIVASIPEGVRRDQVPGMLQTLLRERFKLAVHRENKEQPVYGLIVNKSAPKLVESADKIPAETSSGRTLNSPQGPVHVENTDGAIVVTSGPLGPMRVTGPGRGAPRMELLNASMPGFADMLSQFMDRPVVDMTRLKGGYHLALNFSDVEWYTRNRAAAQGVRLPPPPGAADAGGNGPATASDPSGASIFKAVERLGLKLERRKAPVPMLVVDHLEKVPTEN